MRRTFENLKWYIPHNEYFKCILTPTPLYFYILNSELLLVTEYFDIAVSVLLQNTSEYPFPPPGNPEAVPLSLPCDTGPQPLL